MAVPTHVSTLGSAGSAITSPGNWQTTSADDIIFLTLNLSNSTTPAATGPGDWNHLGDLSIGTTAGNEILLKAYWKRCGASESAPTFSSITGYRFFMNSLIRGCPTSGDPFELNATDTGTSSTPTLAAGTTTKTDQMLVYHIGSEHSGSGGWLSGETNSALSSVTLQYNTDVTGGSGNSRGCVTGELASPGSSGTMTVTAEASSNWAVWGLSFLSTTSVVPGGTSGFRLSLLGVGK